MRARARDTSVEADRVQIELLRQATPARRFAMVRRLSRTAVVLARRAIRRANPEASEEEVGLLFIETHYGADLADRVRRFLAGRKRRAP
jgi:hypothetical protein